MIMPIVDDDYDYPSMPVVNEINYNETSSLLLFYF